MKSQVNWDQAKALGNEVIRCPVRSNKVPCSDKVEEAKSESMGNTTSQPIFVALQERLYSKG